MSLSKEFKKNSEPVGQFLNHVCVQSSHNHVLKIGWFLHFYTPAQKGWVRMGGILHATFVWSHLGANSSQAMLTYAPILDDSGNPHLKNNRRTLPFQLSLKDDYSQKALSTKHINDIMI